MFNVERYAKALHTALGIKRYVFGSIVLASLASYEMLRGRFTDLPDLPTWEIAAAIILLVAVWWLWQRVVALELELEPKLAFTCGEGPPFEITEPINAVDRAIRFCRIKVQH